ncbi:sugar ABC transporter permease [Treponema sp. OMZ 840]|uniref:carbohydrate ABC transporter permease n=1 Tax=Treponema sp. OMZ 840 TaxID=244313 RepID=UPI003D8E9008
MEKRKKSAGIEKKQSRWGLIFVTPAVLFFSVFSFYPIINALIESFFDKRVLSNAPPKFVGFQNYTYIFDVSRYGNPMSFLNSLRATFVFTLGTFIPLLVCSLLFAVLVTSLRKAVYKKIFQIAFYTPAVLSSVVAAAIWLLIFDPRGLGNYWLNTLLRTPGVDYKWLMDSTMTQISTMIVYFWKYIGYFIILFITGLLSIPPVVYEAALIDGANRFQIFWRITLPLLKPTVVLVSIMSMLQCLKTFSTQYLFTQNGASLAPINVVTLNIYQTGIKLQRIGRASAMSIVLFLIMLFLTWLQFRGSKADETSY